MEEFVTLKKHSSDAYRHHDKKYDYMQHIIKFATVFIEMFNVITASILVFLIGHILISMRRVDKDLLKAKLFLAEPVTERTWIYISMAGAAFALNSLFRLVINFTASGDILNAFYLVEVTQLIFIGFFIIAVYNWYLFIGSFTKDGGSE